jgi:hypothetical protein
VDQRVGNLVGKGCCKFMSWYHGRDFPFHLGVGSYGQGNATDLHSSTVYGLTCLK